MNVLAFDTSTNQGGVAILNDRGVLAKRVWTREKSHSEMLTAEIEACLHAARLELHDITRLAVGQGPGSFTGIRIAINAARTLAYARSLPIFAFDTTEILAGSISLPSPLPVLTMVNAHKNLIYVSRFTSEAGRWSRTLGPDALTSDEVNRIVQVPHLCLGDAYIEFESTFPAGLKSQLVRDTSFSDFPCPEVLGRMALASAAKPLVWNELQALYIRASEAEEKLQETLKNRPDH
ncbi:MAG: tRNA (adenosine(37)-N6)-threonylcarbamoyltransferase complex dimerization subunit type 1 TsaB [Bdellovibrionaceae bacterium]|nr:tRNA (adenosine(37)-N6)-threonylcarbamoyltransferase complex dimerization subunit type 1 TsaB [Pseudobdellovibrionaceae bacterium]